MISPFHFLSYTIPTLLSRIKMMLSFFIISFGILTRLIPHIPNVCPEIVFALYLGIKSQKSFVYLYIFLMALISDLIIGWQQHEFLIFGDWTLFTYSALLCIGGLGFLTRKKSFGMIFIGTSCIATLAYWIWTNFGTWLMAGLYSHTLTGLISCYTLALPFLGNSLAASFAWCITIMICENYFSKRDTPLKPMKSFGQHTRHHST